MTTSDRGGEELFFVGTAYGWQAAVNTLTTVRQVVHALRGWPTPYGIAANVAGELVREDGSFVDPGLSDSVEVPARSRHSAFSMWDGCGTGAESARSRGPTGPSEMRRDLHLYLERTTGFEPATPTLARL